MADIDTADGLPPSPSSLGTELWCLGRFWRGQPGGRTGIVEFWLSAHRGIDGKAVSGRWVAGLFDGETDEDVLATFRHHFPYGQAPAVIRGDFARVGNALVSRRDRAA